MTKMNGSHKLKPRAQNMIDTYSTCGLTNIGHMPSTLHDPLCCIVFDYGLVTEKPTFITHCFVYPLRKSYLKQTL